MRKTFLLLFLLLVPVLVSAQQVIQSFDTQLDSTYWRFENSQAADSTKGFINYSLETNEVLFGTGAQLTEYSAHNIEPWGGYSKIYYMAPDSQVMDWSAYDSVSFWYNNVSPQSAAGKVHLRFELYDVSDAPDTTSDANQMEFYYSFHYVLDNAPGWHEIKMPLVDGRAIPELNEWGGEAFNRTGWAGITGNDFLDKDKIKGFAFEFSISGGGEGDVSTGSIILDHLTLKGSNNALTNGGFEDGLTGWGVAIGGGYAEVKSGGAFAGNNYMEIGVTDNNWAVAYYEQGIPAKPKEMWKVSAMMKDVSAADPGGNFGALKMEAKDANGNVLQAWEDIKPATAEWNEFSSTHVMPESTATVGVVLVGTKWTGDGLSAAYGFDNVVLFSLGVTDDIPPDAPAGISAAPNASGNFNLVIWEDVPGESEETYTVYASENPITDVTAEGVERIATDVSEGIQSVVHYLRYPLKNKDVSYYYAVTCTDNAGNTGDAGVSASSVTNTAKGVPVISDKAPASFIADGDVSEWDAAGIVPFVITPENDYPWQSVTDSSDLKGTVYLAFDDDNLYVFADVVDDVYSFGAGNWWDQDAFQLFIGLYNQTSVHNSIMRGPEPDYIIYGNEQTLRLDSGGKDLFLPTDDNYYFEQFSGADYVIEAKIPLDSLVTGDDQRFHPVRGMRIPLEIYFHDNDGSGWEGNLGMSPNATDHQWQTVEEWTYTWVGDTNKVVTAIGDETDAVVTAFSLRQNYPNPFNPTTTIEYNVARTANVKLSIFNLLGQEVEVLVDSRQGAGTHTVKFDASKYSSGVYFYQISSGSFVQTRKMLLVK